MKIGIMGGTFDPIHCGHLLMAEQAREEMKLDQVWFVPAGSPPHKQTKKITDSLHRTRMVQRAVADQIDFRVSTWEIEQAGPSYTITTMKNFCMQYPESDFFLILGADMVNSLPSWYQIAELLQLVQVIALGRPGYPVEKLPDWIQGRVHWVPDSIEIQLASTQIRQRLETGRSVRYLVPDTVLAYIEENRLYGTH
ncbi:nicotinate-nucleotide adenylyltransferase [Risungbinella massiliensis]|uniref:nicotinate-nucleotide adenylyltransferase n=1 Tax=Risungbinella massiliensis TaxID=1329796 RepID=UPI0005CBC1EF|nr:nicotinate-nucleotide adenylyltransferase [Risungbinella massiliensis]